MRERKLSAREVIARSYPSWDNAMADRLIAWLDECGYQIVEKQHSDAILVPDALAGENWLSQEGIR
ncbi:MULTISPECIES: hypothetical protein [unclassified Bradyrhizobium]|uniref:hypothetical protein n=1 Tax=unclassified Bradyrhizobium TaxID=2631580 RepID=UPI002915DAFF|nr:MULTISPECIES: hypothetical protein [unclassified Bradyrhizobium]